MPAPTTAESLPVTLPSRRRMRAEVLIVLGLSLGYWGITAGIRLIERYLAPLPIGNQTQTLNPSVSGIDVIDLILQVLRQGYLLMPVALALYLLSSHGASAVERLGLTGPRRAWWNDIGWGVALAAAIGIPGLALYLVSRAFGQTVAINTSGLPDQWWAVSILLLSAAVAGILEETIAVGYLMTRLRDLAWGLPAAIIASALLRGSYHLYQGWPMALGNVMMGLLFAWWYAKRGRLAPLIFAHLLLDLVAFIGPEVAPQAWLAALGLA
jgi:membrane protease YdiL (CAAX protease family)